MAEKAKLKEQESVSVDRIAEISNRIREALRAALPAPPEQFFTVMVPGKVVNFADYMEGFDANGAMTAPVLPTVTELNNAALCDDMPALAAVQLGPTGRSVSRSYAATLSKLIPKGTTVGLESGSESTKSDAQKRYDKAMTWLTGDDEQTGRPRIDIYVEKQEKYTKAVDAKTKAFDVALARAKTDPANKTVAQQRAAYDIWVSENTRTYRNFIQAAYMDWVIAGKKEAVEYYFSIVDNDTAMARVENSKEAMRNATVMDDDGAAEYAKVKLTPSNWAWIAQQKATGGAPSGTRTVEQLTWEIQRLQKRNRMLEVLRDNPPSFKPTGPAPDTKAADDKQRAAMKVVVEKSTAARHARADTAKPVADKKRAEDELAQARQALEEASADYDKANLERLTHAAAEAQDQLFAGSKDGVNKEIEENNAEIKRLDDERNGLLKTRIGRPSDIIAGEVGLESPPGAGRAAPPATGTGPPPVVQADYWTPITVNVEASYEHKDAKTSTSSTSAAASGSFGMFSASVAVSHDKSSSDASSQMAKSSVKVSFECMRVDISRVWLRPELFYDAELICAPDNFISPGPKRLLALMDPERYKDDPPVPPKDEDRQAELDKYGQFPMFPTAFLLAANVVLEISGETASIQTHFDSSSTSVKANVGYGPFHVSASHSQSQSHSSSTCETTASGCRITIKSPQVIGWVSEIVPALPRLRDIQQARAAQAPGMGVVNAGLPGVPMQHPGGDSAHPGLQPGPMQHPGPPHPGPMRK